MFSKCKDTDTAVETADRIFEHIFKHDGLTDNIAPGSDPTFLSASWRSLMERSAMILNALKNQEPHTYGAIEIRNRVPENIL